jgi:hypothetical protein
VLQGDAGAELFLEDDSEFLALGAAEVLLGVVATTTLSPFTFSFSITRRLRSIPTPLVREAAPKAPLRIPGAITLEVVHELLSRRILTPLIILVVGEASEARPLRIPGAILALSVPRPAFSCRFFEFSSGMVSASALFGALRGFLRLVSAPTEEIAGGAVPVVDSLFTSASRLLRIPSPLAEASKTPLRIPDAVPLEDAKELAVARLIPTPLVFLVVNEASGEARPLRIPGAILALSTPRPAFSCRFFVFSCGMVSVSALFGALRGFLRLVSAPTEEIAGGAVPVVDSLFSSASRLLRIPSPLAEASKTPLRIPDAVPMEDDNEVGDEDVEAGEDRRDGQRLDFLMLTSQSFSIVSPPKATREKGPLRPKPALRQREWRS